MRLANLVEYDDWNPRVTITKGKEFMRSSHITIGRFLLLAAPASFLFHPFSRSIPPLALFHDFLLRNGISRYFPCTRDLF